MHAATLSRTFLSIALMVLLVAPLSLAQVPRTISYQGTLTDARGTVVPDGNYNLTFKLYDTASGGTPLWTEVQSVAVSKGIFSVILGSAAPLNLPFNKPYYLGVTVESGAELSPRIPLTSSGYSFRAASTDSINGIPAGGDLTGTYPNPTIANNAVTTAKIADQAVTQAKLAPGVSLPPGGAAGGDLTGTYPNPSIAAGAVNTAKLADNAVTTAKIADQAVTQAKLAPGVSLPPGGAAGGDLTGTYPNPSIAAGAVNTAKLADNAVTTAKIADQAVTQAKLAPGVSLPPGGAAGGDLTGTYPNPSIAAGAVNTAKLADNAVTTAKIADQAVTQAKLAPGVSLPPGGSAGGDLTGTYPNPSIAAGAVNTAKLADNAVTTAKIADQAVTQAKLAPGVSLPPGGTAGGDLSGTYPNPTVTGLQNRPVSSTAPTSGQVLKWTGTAWAPASVDMGTNYWSANGNHIYNNNAGNVGIGTNNPYALLSLGGGEANTKLAIWQGGTASDVMGLGVGPSQFRLHLYNSTNRFSFLDAPNGSEIMTILGNGNVGIGTSNPYARLSLGGGEANTKLAIWQGGTASDVMGLGVGPSQFRLHLYNSTNRFSFLDAPNGSEIMTILGNGNVGIGTSNPQARLHVNGGNAYFANNNTTLQLLPGKLFDQIQANAATIEIPGNGALGVWDDLTVTGTLRAYGNLHVGGNYFSLGGGTDPVHRRVDAVVQGVGGNLYAGALYTMGANANRNVSLTWQTDNPNHGYVGVNDGRGAPQAEVYVDGNGDGVITARWKFFREPDPDDPTRDIWYGCIEGPELAMYVRGTARLVNGRARIELPDHFRKLADEQGMTVQLTPRSAESKGLAAVRVSLEGIEVAELLNGRGNYEFDWRVEAVRRGQRDFRVYRPWDEVLPGGTDPAQAWQARLKSVQARRAR